MFNNILVPTDGSDTAEAALEHAIDLASRADAVIHVVYVADVTVARGGPMLDLLTEEGQRATKEAASRVSGAGLSVTRAVVEGKPSRAILEYADEARIDLIVMGTHGRTGLDRLFMGSVAGRVVRLAKVPVLTIRRP
ncbi:universal stress protein [Halomarina halobia]|uniref:Universal stress protein n=2 Tax=Halomarina halobia TaxID=3033386 RepID=A0ABD6AG76_9EURY|nr:universal stress protein [Halomarina sp. PSR21]